MVYEKLIERDIWKPVSDKPVLLRGSSGTWDSYGVMHPCLLREEGAYRLSVVMDQAGGKNWQYSKTEIEFAEFLSSFCRALLEAEPDGYHDALQALLQASGGTAFIKHD